MKMLEKMSGMCSTAQQNIIKLVETHCRIHHNLDGF